MLRSVFASAHVSSHASPFVERFKYNVISSSLLSSSLSAPHHGRQSPFIPGRLSPTHRSAESTDVPIAKHSASSAFSQAHPTSASHPEHDWVPTLAFGAFVAILTAGYYVLAIFWFAGAYYYYTYISHVDSQSKPSMLSVSMLFFPAYPILIDHLACSLWIPLMT
jgi:hypothetical protein